MDLDQAGERGSAAAPDASGHSHETACLNCGTALVGSHCHACGQRAHVHRTIGAFFHDLLHGVFHFEGKIWRTLPMLAVRPGELTRRYVEGERVKFVSPIAMFLFAMFLMFAVISTMGPLEPRPLDPADKAEISAGLSSLKGRLDREMAEIVHERETAAAAGADLTEIDEHKKDIDLRLTGVANAQKEVEAGRSPRLVDVRFGWPPLDHMFAKASANPSLLLYKLQSSAYKYSWAIIALSVPFVSLLFLRRRGVTLYDHTVMITYSLVFMTFLAIALSLLAAAGVRNLVLFAALAVIPPVHLFVQVRGAYRLRVWGALWRTAALMVFAALTLVLFLALLLGMGLLG